VATNRQEADDTRIARWAGLCETYSTATPTTVQEWQYDTGAIGPIGSMRLLGHNLFFGKMFSTNIIAYLFSQAKVVGRAENPPMTVTNL